jgi:outer membrane protein assembly factor BamD
MKLFNQTYSRLFFVSLLFAFTLLAAGCGGKDKVSNDNQAIPGRDKELYEEASKKLRKGRYDESRLMYNVIISTYPDSTYLPLAKLAIADSFYLEGGTSQLEQAVGGYKDFAQFFPTHPLTCQVRLKIADAYIRQMNAYNRDATKARQAETQLKATMQGCQTTDLRPEIEDRLVRVQQILSLHSLAVGDFYFDNRKAYKAAFGRYQEIVEQYPNSTYMDKALFRAGQSLIEQEQPEEASQYFTRLVREIPNSEYTKEAKQYLEKLGKPIPEAANNNPAPERPGAMGKFRLLAGFNDIQTSKDGVLVSKKGEADEEKEDAMQKPAEALGTASGVVTSSRAASTLPSGATSAVPSATSPVTNGEPSTTEPASSRSRTIAPGTDAKAEKAKEKENGKKKEKKGLFGKIFK